MNRNHILPMYYFYLNNLLAGKPWSHHWSVGQEWYAFQIFSHLLCTESVLLRLYWSGLICHPGTYFTPLCMLIQYSYLSVFSFVLSFYHLSAYFQFCASVLPASCFLKAMLDPDILLNNINLKIGAALLLHPSLDRENICLETWLNVIGWVLDLRNNMG